jgi:hypothetical protein
MSGSQFQPADLLAMLKAEGAKVKKVGVGTVDGVATTQYRVTVNMAKALQSTGLEGPLLKTVAKRVKTISENVWIDKDNLVRRIALQYKAPMAGGPRMAMTMDISDYGAHLTITAPPSNKVFDATQLAQQGLGSALH